MEYLKLGFKIRNLLVCNLNMYFITFFIFQGKLLLIICLNNYAVKLHYFDHRDTLFVLHRVKLHYLDCTYIQKKLYVAT